MRSIDFASHRFARTHIEKQNNAYNVDNAHASSLTPTCGDIAEAARVEPLLEHAGVIAFTPQDQRAVLAGIHRAVVFETNQRGALHDHHTPAC